MGEGGGGFGLVLYNLGVFYTGVSNHSDQVIEGDGVEFQCIVGWYVEGGVLILCSISHY